jgi:DNA polymerase-3 subunit beta
MQVDRKELARAITLASKVAGKRNGIPALSGVKVTAAAGTLTLEGTDLETSLRIVVDGDGAESWAALIPLTVLRDSVKSSKSERILIAPARVSEVVSAYGGTFAVETVLIGSTTARCLPLEDFPALEYADVDVWLESRAYADAAGVVLPACSRDDGRPVLTGMLHSAGPNAAGDPKLTLVGTDSYRLHVGELPSAGEYAGIVPAHVVKMVVGIIGKRGAGSLGFRIGATSATYHYAGITVAVRLIDGEYPNWQQLVPEPMNGELADGVGIVGFDPDTMVDAIDAAAVVAGDARPIITLTLDDDGVTVSGSSPNLGETVAEVAGATARWDATDSAVLSVSYNPGYLADAIRSVRADRLELRSALKPGIAYGPAGIALVMPVRMPAAVG